MSVGLARRFSEPPYSSGLSGNSEATSVAARKKVYKRNLVATAFSEQSDSNIETSNDVSDSQAHSEIQSESSLVHSSLDTRDMQWSILEEKANRSNKELRRINEDELHRFFAAANGDLSCFLSSIKKTIRWRETYRILSEQELDMWSNMVFWHGFDVENRPCLIVRLGLACLNLPFHERPRFAQAVISQVEHGVLHLVSKDNPQITVLVDCDGISPLRLPMQMMRSCSLLLQDNFPNRLGHLLVIRLPPVVRVIAQTFIQVLKPITRKKLRIEGKKYHRVIFDYLQNLPSYLGGNCTCNICSNIRIHAMRQPQAINEIGRIDSTEFVGDGEDLPSTSEF
ncbi:hypothetical protein GH714_012885 [Hevea brasiliensis]|uniref:CRAL-TRIO domain-containing protein n=1 Tax=Hevea brasiliensis TaxID=3981 RepID=A0A6A6LK36_HEVBR|nr:hypothetical protein GH714_012885 [Hevea brasiliensis]